MGHAFKFHALGIKGIKFFSTSLISALKFIWNENKLYFLPRTPWDETEPNPANYSKFLNANPELCMQFV